MNDAERPRRRLIGRAARAAGWVVLAGAGLAAFLVGLLHLPSVQRAAARAASREAGRVLESSVEAGSIRWSFFKGPLELRDVSLRGLGERSGTEISVPRVRIELSVRDLFRGRTVFHVALGYPF